MSIRPEYLAPILWIYRSRPSGAPAVPKVVRMSPSEEEYFDWDRKSRIMRPSEAADEYMLMPLREFQQLRKRIEMNQASRHENIPSAYYTLFGAALTVGITIPPLFTAKDLASWVIPTYIVSAGALMVLGLILVLLARFLRIRQNNAVSEIAQDMLAVEKIYGGKKALGRSTPRRPRPKDAPKMRPIRLST